MSGCFGEAPGLSPLETPHGPIFRRCAVNQCLAGARVLAFYWSTHANYAKGANDALAIS